MSIPHSTSDHIYFPNLNQKVFRPRKQFVSFHVVKKVCCKLPLIGSLYKSRLNLNFLDYIFVIQKMIWNTKHSFVHKTFQVHKILLICCRIFTNYSYFLVLFCFCGYDLHQIGIDLESVPRLNFYSRGVWTHCASYSAGGRVWGMNQTDLIKQNLRMAKQCKQSKTRSRAGQTLALCLVRRRMIGSTSFWGTIRIGWKWAWNNKMHDL